MRIRAAEPERIDADQCRRLGACDRRGRRGDRKIEIVERNVGVELRHMERLRDHAMAQDTEALDQAGHS
jgi:hypothetical protein